jgi:hypothetical protein
MQTQDICVWQIANSYIDDYAEEIAEHHPTLKGWIRSRDFKRLASCCSLLDIPAQHNPLKLRHLLQVEALFKKNSAFTDLKAARSSAVRNFLIAERTCRITNKRLDYYYAKRDRLLKRDPILASDISVMESALRGLCGSFSKFLNELPDLLKVTSGATATLSRAQSERSNKVRREFVGPIRSYPYYLALTKYLGQKGKIRFVRRDVNRIEFVPKNWKTDRTIACEPDASVAFQLAFDSWLKRRLRARGTNLSDQRLNCLGAFVGSLDGSLSTIDLQMASDTLAYNSVHWLFPSQWLPFLEAFRSPSGFSEDTGHVRYAKYSSMGNGYTFTLETAVFYAACVAVGSRRFAVYGDDIVIETELAPRVIKLLKFFGFSTNPDKTFTDGFFRESCGEFWFKGVDITPFYMRSDCRLNTEKCLAINSLAARSLYNGRLARYLATVSKGHPYCFPQYDLCAGVFVTPTYMYANKLARTTSSKYGPWVVVSKRYTRHSPKTAVAYPPGALFLRLWEGPEDLEKPLDYALIEDHGRSRFRTRWQPWIPSGYGVPEYLHWYEDLLPAPDCDVSHKSKRAKRLRTKS